jgi:hypothetical protein
MEVLSRVERRKKIGALALEPLRFLATRRSGTSVSELPRTTKGLRRGPRISMQVPCTCEGIGRKTGVKVNSYIAAALLLGLTLGDPRLLLRAS